MALKTIEIWMEGFSATGQREEAQRLGVYEANNFDEAVEMYKKEHPSTEIEKKEGFYYDWARRFYDNEADARKFFG